MSYDPVKRNVEYIFPISLISQSTGQIQTNPTIAAGDFKVSTDFGTFNNLGTLPTVTPASGKQVKVTLSASEMNGQNIMLIWSDAAGAEWDDGWASIQTTSFEKSILDQIEFNRGHHTVSGNTFYVDGTAGNDSTGDGTRAAPYLTISKALTQCVSNNHDQVILLPNSGGGPTTITESATISVAKNYVQIRGPGRDVNVTQTAASNRDVFSITASGVELSGFRVTTNGASSNGVTVSGAVDFVRLYRLWIENAHQDAVQFNVANRCEVANCTIVAAGRDGVRVSSGAGSGNYNLVLDSVIRDTVGSAVNLQGTDASDCRIQHNVIRDNAVGVTIAAGVSDTVLTDNRFVNNTVEIADSGTRTLQEWNYLHSDTNGRVDIALIEGVDATNQIRDSILTDATRFAGANIDAAISSRLAPTVAARTLDVTATGAAGVDWGNVENQTTTVNLSDTTIKAVTNRVTANADQWAGQTIPTPAVTGVPKVDLTDIDGLATNGTNATLNLKKLNIHNNNGNAIEAVSDAVNGKGLLIKGSGNEDGLTILGGDSGHGVFIESGQSAGIGVYVHSPTEHGVFIRSDSGVDAGIKIFSAGGTGLYVEGGGIGAEIYGDGDVGAYIYGYGAGRPGIEVVSVNGGKSLNLPNDIAVSDGDLTLGAITDAVWDELIAGHLTGGTTGAALNGAGAAGDPWTTPIPGAYGPGTAGNLVGNNLDAAVSTRSTLAQADIVSDATPFAGANIDATISSRLAAASYVAPDNADIVLIKAKTDQLTFTSPGEVDANIQAVNDTQLKGDGSGVPWGPV